MTSFNPYTPSHADLQQPGSNELELATRGSRLLAVMVDGLTLFGVGIAAALVIPTAAGNATLGLLFGALAGTIFVGVLIYNFVLLYRQGQTIGKRVMHIAVVRKDGNRCGLRRYLFLRVLPVALISGVLDLIALGSIFSLADNLMIFRESRQCLHDLIADTIVVKFHA